MFYTIIDGEEFEFEIKGGKPSKGTAADKRLKDNKPGAADDADEPKKPFPGAAKPFKPKSKDKGK